MRSITFKLILAFLAVSLVGIAILALQAFRVTQVEVGGLIDAHNREAVAARLGEYYRANGSWEGVQEMVSDPAFLDKYGRGFILVDQHGTILPPDPGRAPIRPVSTEEIEAGVPIQVEGQQVGTLVSWPAWVPDRPARQEFLNPIYRNLFIGALGAVVISLLLGVLVARTLTRTLRELTAATQAVARGDLSQQVPVRSRDELGELAASFNRMSADLTHSRDLRRQMTADIAHELRTPISVILGHAEALSEGVLPADPETFHTIHDETQRLKRLVDDLRTLSLSDAGELPLMRSLISPRVLCERAVAAHIPLAQRRDITIQLEAHADLPDVEVDPDRMAQVLDNLLDNALRYTPPGGRIWLSAVGAPDGIELRLQDSGPGIAPEDLPHVFDRFYRGDKARQRQEGESGLGLAIAKSMVESHGGRIWAESPPGEGARFMILLPGGGKEVGGGSLRSEG